MKHLHSAQLRHALRGIVATLMMSCLANFALAAETELLWPHGAPEAVGEQPEDQPTLTIYRPTGDKHVPTAVVVCPGGGYGGLAKDHEGVQIAEWLNSQGVTAAVLHYRHAPRYQHPAPLTDVRRAIQTVRARAAELNVSPDRIGIIGFSAGGHLASTAGTQFLQGNSEAEDPIERVSSRPDFMLLMYPVISMISDFTHQGSKRNLLGPEPPEDVAQRMSSELRVTDRTPPTFLLHTGEDRVVPPENALVFYMALRQANVPVEMHIYEHGPHGVGLAADDPQLATWPGLAAGWMRKHGWLD